MMNDDKYFCYVKSYVKFVYGPELVRKTTVRAETKRRSPLHKVRWLAREVP
jgi:hypothetical protein